MLYFRSVYLSCLQMMLASCGVNLGKSTQMATNKLVPTRNLMHLNSPDEAFSSIQESEVATHTKPLDGF